MLFIVICIFLIITLLLILKITALTADTKRLEEEKKDKDLIISTLQDVAEKYYESSLSNTVSGQTDVEDDGDKDGE